MMAEQRGIAGKGALIVIMVVEALIAVAAVAVGAMTGHWLPVIIVLVLAGVISLIALLRLRLLQG